jgi:translation elongation factor EF-1beta
MSIKDILAKFAKGDALNDEEKKAIAEFDPDKLAAAARKDGEKKAKDMEAKLAELQEQLEAGANVGKTEVEKLKAENEKAVRKLAELKTQLDTTLAEKAKFIRGSKLEQIAGKIKTVPGVDAQLVRMALEAKLAGLKDEELDGDAVEPVLKSFRDANKAIIVDESGHGTGTKNDGSNRSGGTAGKTIKRSEFDALAPAAKDSHMKSGGKITD